MNDVHTLSGAYALDALAPDEAADFRRHLAECQVCRDEVFELRHAAALMGSVEAAAPPPSLRTRVLAIPGTTPQLPPLVAEAPAASATPPERTDRGGDVVPITRGRRRWAGLLSAAAAVVLVAVGVTVWQGQQDDSGPVAEPVVSVFKADDAHTLKMTVTVGDERGTLRVATSPDRGEMAVDTHALPAPEAGKVYQLWAITDGKPASAGVLDDYRTGAAMALPVEGTQVAITEEPAGGSDQPTSEPIAVVDPYAV